MLIAVGALKTGPRMHWNRIGSLRNRHRGQRCVIVANGPSLNHMELGFLRREHVIGMNKIFLGFAKFGFYPRYYVAVNPKVVQQSEAQIQALNCVRFIGGRAAHESALHEDALMNNAAVQILGGFDSLTRSDWQQTLRVNLLAPCIWKQALMPGLEAAKGSVVNISSIHARLTKKNFVAYATSRAALSDMTRAMAADLGGRVRVNPSSRRRLRRRC